MSHPPDLIARISKLVERDYPVGKYRYQFEKALPGSRMFPDILVMDRTGALICAVEIGYTRPEKLSAYRAVHKIADVRWYGKDGALHTPMDSRSVRVTVQADPAHDFSVYHIRDSVPCFASDCVCTESEDDIALHDCAVDGVETLIIHDGIRVFLFNFCDKCTESWLEQDREKITWIIDEFAEHSGHSHARAFGARERLSWPEVKSKVQEWFRMEVIYEDGLFINEPDDRAYHALAQRMRMTRRPNPEIVD